jgi:hypothetical protein
MEAGMMEKMIMTMMKKETEGIKMAKRNGIYLEKKKMEKRMDIWNRKKKKAMMKMEGDEVERRMAKNGV